jgi:hypothetical protein
MSAKRYANTLVLVPAVLTAVRWPRGLSYSLFCPRYLQQNFFDESKHVAYQVAVQGELQLLHPDAAASIGEVHADGVFRFKVAHVVSEMSGASVVLHHDGAGSRGQPQLLDLFLIRFR